ncbi:MAG: cobalamin-dependent protein [Pseudomonadota bacterium]
MTKEGPLGRLNLQSIDRIVSQQLELKSRLRSTGARTLAQQILEQVAAKHDSIPPARASAPNFFQVELLARALIDEDEDASSAFVARLQEVGTSPQEIYLSYLAEAARMLGKWWEEDRASFAEVTIGASRIYGILRVMDESFTPRNVGHPKRALFVAPKGESHRLGVKMASDLFRRKGWDIELLLGETQEEVLDHIRRGKHVIVGLSSAGTHSTTELAKLVLAIRIHHPDVFIMISGQALDDMEETLSAMLPDALEQDFNSALDKLEEFWVRATLKKS